MLTSQFNFGGIYETSHHLCKRQKARQAAKADRRLQTVCEMQRLPRRTRRLSDGQLPRNQKNRLSFCREHHRRVPFRAGLARAFSCAAHEVQPYGQARSHRNKGGSQMRMIRNNSSINIEHLVADEVKRLSLQFGKSFLDCEDIISLTGLGRDNVRALMRSRRFPVVKVGKQQVVSILNFVTWQINENTRANYYAA